MSKKKTSTDDFLRLLDDEETSSQPVAFSPHADNKQRTLYETKLSQSESSLPSERVKRWERAAKVVGKSGLDVLKEFQTKERFKSLP